MATTTTLGFSILSRYSGRGLSQARRDIAETRAFMGLLNEDMTRHGKILDGIPKRWRLIGGAVAGLAPALVPLTAQLLATAGALTTMATAAGVAGGVWGMALKGAISRINDTNLGLMGLEKNLAKQKAILANMTPGTAHYEKQLKKVASAQDQYTHALADADPAQKRFMNSMLAMDTAWQKFISATQGQTLGVASKVMDALAVAVGKLLPLVSAMTPLANQVADAFRHWVDIKMDGWVSLFSQTGPRAMSAFITIAKNLGSVFGSMLKAFAGEADKLGNSLAVASAKLKGWADGGGFQRFLQYVKDNGPAVQAFWRAFGDALHTIMENLKGFSGGALSLLTDALRAISQLNFENVKAAAQSFLLLRSPIAFLVLNCPPLRDAMIGLLGAMNPATIYAMAGAFVVFKGAILAMNLGLASTPVGWVIIALAALAVAVVWVATQTKFFQTVWQYIWGFMKAVAAWFAGPFVGFFQAIGAWFAGPFVGFFQAVGAWFSGPFVGFFKAIGAWFSGPFIAFFQAVGAWFSGPFVGFFQAVWSGIQTAWSAFITALQTTWSAVSAVLVAAWNAVWNGIKTAAEAVWTFLQAAWSGFINGLQVAWSAVSAFLSSSWSAVWNAIKIAAQAVWTFLQAAWQLFLTGVQTTWTAISTALQAAWNFVWNAIKTAATTIWNLLKAAWQLFLTGIQTVWTTVSAVLQAAWSAVWNAIKTAATTIWDALKAAWSAFTSAIQTAWDTAGKLLSGAWEAVWNGLKSAASKVWHEIGEVIEKAINGIIGIINKISDGINAIASKVGLGDIVGHIDTVSINFAVGGIAGDLPHFSAGGTINFANGGGTLSGYAPGRDTIPAVLSRGEGVLTPEAVRGLGGAGFVHAANRKFAGHRGAGKGAGPLAAYGFATGGIVGGVANVGGGVEAWHRSGPDPGWSFALGGLLPNEIPVPGGGTVGQTPGENVNKPSGSVTDLLPDDLPDPVDLAKQMLGIGGLNSMVLGFIGREAIEKMFNPLFNMLNGFGMAGEFGKILVAAARKVVEGAMEWLIKKDEEAKEEYESHAVAGAQSVQAWAPLAAKALALAGLAPSQLPAFLALMAAESGGNPNAINGWDINARNGVPSQGLMQVIPPTFAAYHVPGTSNNILDPLANMAASANYIKHRYGGIVPGSPYALGTPGATSGVHLVGELGPELVNFNGGETVTPAKETASILSGAGTPAAMATAAPAAAAPSAGGVTGGGGMSGSSVSSPTDVQGLIQALLESSGELQAQIDAMWKQVVASTNSGWSTVNGDSLTPMNAALAGTVPASLTALQTAWTAGWTAVGTTATTQWTAVEGTAFTPMNTMMTTTVPAAATTMQTGVTDATSQMQAGVQESWDATLSGTQTTWTGISDSITQSVDTATVPINGLLGGFNNVSSALGMGISVPLIAYEAGGVAAFSTGGMLAKNGGAVPGYSPGRDTFPAMLSPGEGVLTPEAVRGLGGPGFVYAANRKYSGHRGGGGSTSEPLGKYMGKQTRCGHATGGMAGVMKNGVAHFASGTITAQDASGLAEAGVSTGLVTQGSFSTGVAASAGTHDGDGVVDLGTTDPGIESALRNVGWAAWIRGNGDGMSPHTHAVLMRATGIASGAQAQVIDFINGGTGLGAGSVGGSSAALAEWGLGLGHWDFGPLIKSIIDGQKSTVPPRLKPLVLKKLTRGQVESGFSGLKGALDATDMGTGMFADSNMQLGIKTHDGAVNRVAAQATSYDQGGLLQPGYTLAFNGTGKPEPVGHNLEPKGSRGEIRIEMPIHIHGDNVDPEAVAESLNARVLPKLRQALTQGVGNN